MNNDNQNKKTADRPAAADDQPKIVAEMPQDQEMREHLDEMKRSDGHPGSCGL